MPFLDCYEALLVNACTSVERLEIARLYRASHPTKLCVVAS